MFCMNCGGRIDDAQLRAFCPYCGKPVKKAPSAAAEAGGDGTQDPNAFLRQEPQQTAGNAGFAQQSGINTPESLRQTAQGQQGEYIPQQPVQQQMPPQQMRQGVPPMPQYASPAPVGQPGAVQPQKKKSGAGLKVLLVILILLLCGLIAGGVYYYFFMDRDTPDEDEDTSKPAVTQQADVTDPTQTEPSAADPQSTQPPESVSETVSVHEPDTAESTTAAPQPVTDPQEKPKYAPGNYVNSTYSVVNLRADHNSSSAKLGSIGIWEKIYVTEVYEDTSSTSAYTRWWGKIVRTGQTGWVALYYFTCTDMGTETFDEQALTELWQLLSGYWNTLDKKRFAAFTVEDGKCYFTYGTWYSEVSFSAYAVGSCTGSRNGVIKLRIYSPGSSGGEGPGLVAINTDLYLDLSEIANKRIAWNFGQNWEDGHYAGSTMDAARPPLS